LTFSHHNDVQYQHDCDKRVGDDWPDTRPEIELCFWDITNLKWPIKAKTKPDLIIFDPYQAVIQ
jgi:hypothetical protein